MEHLAQAVRLTPQDAEVHYTLGMARYRQGQVMEAVEQLAVAVQLNPDHVEAQNSIGEALLRLGRGAEAAGHLERAVQLKPDFVTAQFNLGTVLLRQGRVSEAIGRFRKVLELDPREAMALNSLAWILATETDPAIRNVEEAIRHAKRACEWTSNTVAAYLDTLAVAYSEAGRFGEAVRAGEQAVDRARAVGNQEIGDIIEERLKHYREGRPYRATLQKNGP
jgi:Flp pilus assembly protein TadD